MVEVDGINIKLVRVGAEKPGAEPMPHVQNARPANLAPTGGLAAEMRTVPRKRCAAIKVGQRRYRGSASIGRTAAGGVRRA